MNFLIENVLLVVVALVSGGMLFYPMFARRGASVSTQDAVQRMNRSKALVIDVRTAEDYSAGHIREARHVLLAEFDAKLGYLEKFKEKPVLVVCANGMSAPRAVSRLKKAGFTDVVSLAGGMKDWAEQNLPVFKS